MRSADEGRRTKYEGLALGLIAGLLLGGCSLGAGGQHWAAALPENGPQADFPVVIGEPYEIAGTVFTPEDVLNYDEVGFAAMDAGEGVSAAHHTLPVPSYVEITSLETGRTALVRIERRGPMDGLALVALSPGAAVQLGAGDREPVRVRRVNPPEEQRALLRAGEAAALRMDTPMPLVEVLRRKLPAAEEGALALPTLAASGEAEDAAGQAAPPAAEEQVAADVAEDFDVAFADVDADPPPATGPVTAGRFAIQAAAFSTEDRARRVAEEIGGSVSRAGAFFRVRTGPFSTRDEAEAALAKVRDAGYSDARIFTNG